MRDHPKDTTISCKNKWKFALSGSKTPAIKEAPAHLHIQQNRPIYWHRDSRSFRSNNNNSKSYKKRLKPNLFHRITPKDSRFDNNNQKWQESSLKSSLRCRTKRTWGKRFNRKIFHNRSNLLDIRRIRTLMKKHKYAKDSWKAFASLECSATYYILKLN